MRERAPLLVLALVLAGCTVAPMPAADNAPTIEAASLSPSPILGLAQPVDPSNSIELDLGTAIHFTWVRPNYSGDSAVSITVEVDGTSVCSTTNPFATSCEGIVRTAGFHLWRPIATTPDGQRTIGPGATFRTEEPRAPPPPMLGPARPLNPSDGVRIETGKEVWFTWERPSYTGTGVVTIVVQVDGAEVCRTSHPKGTTCSGQVPTGGHTWQTIASASTGQTTQSPLASFTTYRPEATPTPRPTPTQSPAPSEPTPSSPSSEPQWDTTELHLNTEKPKLPLVLLHGWNGDAESMRTLAADGKSLGYDVIVIQYEPHAGRAKIEDMAQDVQRAVHNETTKRGYTADQKFNIIAHSMGGLIARDLIEGTGGWKTRVQTLVMLGTPNAGSFRVYEGGCVQSEYVLWAYGAEACMQMKPGSSFYTRLDGWPESIRYVTIAGHMTGYDHDGLVKVSSALLSGSTKIQLPPHICHSTVYPVGCRGDALTEARAAREAAFRALEST